MGTAQKESPEVVGLELEEDSPDFNSLTALDYETIDYTPPQQTLGQFMEQHVNQQPPSNQGHSRAPSEGRSSEEVLEELKRESSAIRPKSSS